MAIQAIGLIRELEPEATACPSLEDLRDEMDPSVIERVCAYLRSGDIILDVMEYVADPLDPTVGIAGGSGLQSDGEWVWRQDLPHYVQRYRIRLPLAFVAAASTRSPPTLGRSQHAEALRAWNVACRPPDAER